MWPAAKNEFASDVGKCYTRRRFQRPVMSLITGVEPRTSWAGMSRGSRMSVPGGVLAVCPHIPQAWPTVADLQAAFSHYNPTPPYLATSVYH
ncbi:hypothetical protein AAFF_G00129120 [Aldrovandia affinis]|uniref:Uncharacterized protein n=1 Tax=Aldrovandia affinis TaxID=143900 RepID=A0AAD7T1D7_9TELE|nr:hypothetical protein AAFF_G00129120 [Aldrovandia affinis]